MSTLSVLLQLAAREGLHDDTFARALSAARVKTAKAGPTPQKLADGGGLILHLAPSGAKTWQYRFRLEGREQTLTIGQFPSVALEEARRAHRAARWLVERGTHPGHFARDEIARQEGEARRAELNTFRAVSEQWLAASASGVRPSTQANRKGMLENHVLPRLGPMALASITRKDVVGLIEHVAAAAPVSAARCLMLVRQVFDFALAHELVDASPVPGMAAVGKAVPIVGRRAVEPRKALPMSSMGAFLAAIDGAQDSDVLTKAALRLLALTWCRTQEVTGARWDEFDLDAGTWVIPAGRMKAGESHTVYLSAQAATLLRELRLESHGEYLFPNRRHPDQPMNRTTLTEWRKRHGFAGLMEIHGLRATASTWANDAGHRPDVVEAALAHKEADRVRASYNRASYEAQRRELAQAWGDELDRRLAMHRAGNVVTLGRAA
jgi:integrase